MWPKAGNLQIKQCYTGIGSIERKILKSSFFGSSKTLPWLRWLVAALLPRRAGFEPGSVYVWIVVGWVAMGKGFVSIFWFPLSISSHNFPFSYSKLLSNRMTKGKSLEAVRKVMIFWGASVKKYNYTFFRSSKIEEVLFNDPVIIM